MIIIDGSDVLSFSRQLRDVPKDMRRGLRKSIVEASDVLVSRAKSNASWSSRIPDAIKAKAGFGTRAGVEVIVDSDIAPHARAYEGMANQTMSGYFRHPVFGGDAWVEESTRPFLRPAIRDTEPLAVERIQAAINAAFGQV